MVISANLKMSTLFVVSQVLSAKVSSEWRLNLGFGTQKMCPFSLNGGVPFIQVTDTKIIWVFFREQNLCPPNGGVPEERGSTIFSH